MELANKCEHISKLIFHCDAASLKGTFVPNFTLQQFKMSEIINCFLSRQQFLNFICKKHQRISNLGRLMYFIVSSFITKTCQKKWLNGGVQQEGLQIACNIYTLQISYSVFNNER